MTFTLRYTKTTLVCGDSLDSSVPQRMAPWARFTSHLTNYGATLRPKRKVESIVSQNLPQ